MSNADIIIQSKRKIAPQLDVMNQVSQILYGKPCGSGESGILGRKQAVLSNSLKSKTIKVIIPMGTETLVGHTVDYYIKNMVRHGKEHGVNISVNPDH